MRDAPWGGYAENVPLSAFEGAANRVSFGLSGDKKFALLQALAERLGADGDRLAVLPGEPLGRGVGQIQVKVEIVVDPADAPALRPPFAARVLAGTHREDTPSPRGVLHPAGRSCYGGRDEEAPDRSGLETTGDV